jgi:uncharacterized membrane protein YdbT with pleckstrin-like domain
MDPEPGEQVFFHGHPSWRSILNFYVLGLLAVIAIGVVAGLITDVSSNHVQAGWVAVAVLIALAALLLIGLIRLIQTTYTITSRRLTIRSGIITRELHETRLERIQNVNSTQSLLERLLRIGTIDFDTAASSECDFKFRGVGEPERIVRTVDRAIEEFQRSGAGALGPGAGQGPGAIGGV